MTDPVAGAKKASDRWFKADGGPRYGGMNQVQWYEQVACALNDQEAEIERLTKQRDHARAGNIGWEIQRTALEASNLALHGIVERQREALERIAGMCLTHADDKAWKAFSQMVRARDGDCTAIGTLDGECLGYLQAAHIIGRRNQRVRFDRDSGERQQRPRSDGRQDA